MYPNFTTTAVTYYLFSFYIYQVLSQHGLRKQHSRIVTLIHDDSINLQYPEKSMEILVQVIAGNLESQCQDSVSMNAIHATPETDLNKELAMINHRFNKQDGANVSKAFIIITQCGTAEAIIHHLWTLHTNPNIIFLDFFICQPLQRSEGFHLETFRFKVEIFPACVQLATQKWIEETVCSSEMDQNTKNFLTFTFSTDIVVEECNRDRGSNLRSEIYLSNMESEKNYIRRFLSGKQLRVASIEDLPYVWVDRSPGNNSVINYLGFPFDMFNILQECFNFTYVVLTPENRLYGTTSKNGTWNGLLGMVFNKEADIVVHKYFVTQTRYSAFDFVIISSDPSTILIPATTEDYKLFACSKPFQMEVWIGVLIVLIILPFTIWICAQNLQVSPHNSSGTSLKQIYLFVYSVLVSQSNGPKIPRNKTILIFLVTVWSLATVILSNVYKGKIVSSLLIPKFNPIINSIEDLPTSSMKWMIIHGSAMESLFMGAEEKDTIYWKIGEGLRQNQEAVIHSQIESTIRKFVASGEYAAIYSLSYFEYLMEQDYLDTKQCRLGLAKERFYQPGLEGLVLRKDSPLATIFTKKILEVMQSGLDHYWRLKDRRKISATENCKTPDASQREPVLTLRTLQDSFLILAVGLGLASVAFVVEIVHHKIWTSRIRSNRTV